jgi:hypothetical protein
MSKFYRKTKKRISKMERGQVLVLVALAAVGIIAIVGLVMDVGVMFIGNARLRRATDAAALAAALQYREGVQTEQLTTAATEFLTLNGVTLDSDHPVTVDTCISAPDLCRDPATDTIIPRKLVRVRASATVGLAFLPVIGINSVPITAEATSETASLDLVLVIDTSESMTFDAPLPQDDPDHSPLRDPTICNYDDKAKDYTDTNDGMPGECHPFEEVKQAAVNFIEGFLYFPYDRVAIVTFDRQATNILQFNQNCLDPNGCSPDDIKATVENAIKNLNVYEGEDVCDNGQPCRPYCLLSTIVAGYCDSQPDDVKYFLNPDENPHAVYKGNFDCGDGWYFNPGDLQDPSNCTTTNIGDGLLVAGDEYSQDSGGRLGSLWVTVLLTDGSANAGTAEDGSSICPRSTWNPQTNPLCRDFASSTRHCALADSRGRCILNGNGLPVFPDNPLGVYQAGVWNPTDYDADDYARDMADFVGLDQGALIFSIGLGRQVKLPASDPAGERLLEYASEKVGNGLYFYAPSPTDLADIFKKIGDNIAIRLAH